MKPFSIAKSVWTQLQYLASFNVNETIGRSLATVDPFFKDHCVLLFFGYVGLCAENHFELSEIPFAYRDGLASRQIINGIFIFVNAENR